jgi:Asp-tRNA(Asn)/Glu-tRNA(Gln) amidotransferase A subunit family amidase
VSLLDSEDALGLAALIARREVTAHEVLDEAIGRFERLNPQLNAVVMPLVDRALGELRRGLPDGRFKGVPFFIKDLVADYAGVPTTAGCRSFVGLPAAADSEIVRRFRAAGLVILGKTNTSELGLAPTTEPSLFGPTRNPWNKELSPGGSSGGSAAAVAARIAPMAHATDGGGSIRIPASCCGLFGLKPTRGRVSMGPVVGETLAGAGVQHVVTRSVRDSAALLDAVAGPAPGDPYSAVPHNRPYRDEVGAGPGRLRIAFSTTAPNGATVWDEVKTAVTSVAELCRSLGHIVEEAAPDYDWEALQKASVTITAANTRRTIEVRSAGQPIYPDNFERLTFAAAEFGRQLSAVDYVAAVQTIHRAGRQIAPFFEQYDLHLTPVLTQPELPLGTVRMDSSDFDAFNAQLFGLIPFTYVQNMTGQPAMSVPLHWSKTGVPVGVQFAAPYGDEATLFRLAGQLERARPWKNRKPALPG